MEGEVYVTDAPLIILKNAKWIPPEENWHAPIQPAKQLINELTIAIKTSGETFSGTDDDVTLYAHYLDASGREVLESSELNTSMHNDFETNDVDTFQWKLQGPVPLENFLYFEVKKKGKDDWVVEWIKISDAQTGVLLGSVEGRFELSSKEDYVRINAR